MILVALAIWNHLGKKKKKKRNACFFLQTLIFSPFVFLVSRFTWKNLPDCIKPDATGIVHFLMRSRDDSTVKRYLKEIQKFIHGARLAILASNFLFLFPPVENTYRPGHVYPLRYFQKIRGYWSLRHLIRMLFP